MDKNGADFTQKELCLLLKTICKNELGVYVANNVKDLRAQNDIFKNDDTIVINRVQNKQGTTRVFIFVTHYCNENNEESRAYTATI